MESFKSFISRKPKEANFGFNKVQDWHNNAAGLPMASLKRDDGSTVEVEQHPFKLVWHHTTAKGVKQSGEGWDTLGDHLEKK